MNRSWIGHVPPLLFAALVALPAVLPAGLLTAQGSRTERAERFLRAHHDLRLFNGAALIVDGGQVLFRGAFGFADLERDIANESETRFRIASLADPFTAALVLRLAEEGSIRLDAPIRTYLPEYPSPQGDGVTIHDLLTHAPEELPDDTSAHVVLERVVERVTGRAYDEVLREVVLDPSGLGDTGYDHATTPERGHAVGYTRNLTGFEGAPVIDPSQPRSTGVLYSTVDDLHRWSRALAGWKLVEYGYGARISRRTISREDSVRIVDLGRHGGELFGFSSMLRVFPDHDRMIILLDNTSSNLDPVVEGLTNLLWGAETRFPKPSIAERLLPLIESAGVEPAMGRYRTWKRTRPDQYDYGLGELMRLARHFREADDPEAAAMILETQVEGFPSMPGARLALSELYAEMGDTARAVSHLETALLAEPGGPSLLEALLALGAEPPAALRVPLRQVSSEALGRLVGEYRIDPSTTLTVRLRDGGLSAVRTGEEAFPLLPQSDTTFLIEDSTIQVIFHLEDGHASSVSVLESGQRVTFPRVPSARKRDRLRHFSLPDGSVLIPNN